MTRNSGKPFSLLGVNEVRGRRGFYWSLVRAAEEGQPHGNYSHKGAWPLPGSLSTRRKEKE